ncbi:carbohydrate ABC transporter substrate-binding protein, CUT1 family [Marinitoga hydrogenitolerans DSM 16785]|uniref:Carbohydrate ABC transporter substrate-binding protein, CUT1 family n=1 Tax=Marinitoga hydrogenitolerans (strain DSM 16785 / JCM 12826 / AT1271) TaxID=1122195 RepID=A0A1M4WHJ5_MARH1|nr:sugar ABC transporter substrate-binding protein [Marinitoga hydrogenitolerans]SHE80442.1 carbohydrate ABC transporter substrate-binding protein, CUT1 family [Marinitoga hydrogenitolerans DSM 16785]
MKKLTILLVLVLLVSSFVQAKVTLKFWNFWSDNWIGPMIEDFMKENPDIEVQIERLTWSDGFNKIVTAFAAGDTPDVLELGSTWVSQFAADGALKEVDVSDIVDQYNMWDPVIYKGKYYGYPWVLSTRILFYNKDLFKKAGLDPELPPRTWKELYDAAEKISSLDDDIFGFGIKVGGYTTWQTFLPFAWSNGGNVLSDDWKKAAVDSAEFINALKYVQSLTHFSMIDSNLNVRQAFMQGKVGIILDDIGKIKTFAKDAPELNFGYSLFVRPDKLWSKPIQFGGAEVIVIPANTKYPEAAEKLARYIVSKKASMAISSRIPTLVPADKSVKDDDFYKKQTGFDVIIKQLQFTKTPPAHPKWIDIQEVLTQYITEVYNGTMNAEIAMKDAAEEINIILEEFEEEYGE